MSNGASKNHAQAYDPIRALIRAGRNNEAIVKLCAIDIIQPHDFAVRKLLFDAFYQKREWRPAAALAEELLGQRPDDARLQKALIATLSNMQRYEETIARASRYVEQHGEDLLMLDALKVAYFYTGQTGEAIRWGQRVLDLRDAEACANPPPVHAIDPVGPPSGQNVISFSLWGDAPIYVYGAMINLVLSRTVYPDWICRFYVDATVPPRCVAFLRDNGADVRNIGEDYPRIGFFQRFLVMDDRAVGRFLVRDCDARLSAPEAELVRQWIDSGLPFHVVRDHVLHSDLMLAGLWAGRTDCGIGMANLIRRYFPDGPSARYGHDQRMLRLLLWPLIRGRCLVHDKYYRLAGVHAAPLPDPDSHFGGGHQQLGSVLEEAEQLGIPRML